MLKNFFWDIYAESYDFAVMHFYPYLRLIVKIATEIKKRLPFDAKILVLCSGTSNLEKRLVCNKHFEISSVDFSFSMVEKARRKFLEHTNIRFFVEDIYFKN